MNSMPSPLHIRSPSALDIAPDPLGLLGICPLDYQKEICCSRSHTDPCKTVSAPVLNFQNYMSRISQGFLIGLRWTLLFKYSVLIQQDFHLCPIRKKHDYFTACFFWPSLGKNTSLSFKSLNFGIATF